MTKLSTPQTEELLLKLKQRFKKHPQRHKGIEWTVVESKLKAQPEKLKSLKAMEESGGEPDVVGFDKASGEYLFFDCSAESPKGRRSLCYDREALEWRKQNKPIDSVMDMAKAMGIVLLDEAQYRMLQELGDFDTKTSSWIKTPADIRALGGAIFADFRYGKVFIYHNSAPSYYASRGFRGSLRV